MDPFRAFFRSVLLSPVAASSALRLGGLLLLLLPPHDAQTQDAMVMTDVCSGVTSRR